jgi:hypothetical protein
VIPCRRDGFPTVFDIPRLALATAYEVDELATLLDSAHLVASASLLRCGHVLFHAGARRVLPVPCTSSGSTPTTPRKATAGGSNPGHFRSKVSNASDLVRSSLPDVNAARSLTP